MKKRIFAVLLALCLALALVPTAAFAADANGFTINQTGVLTKYTGASTDVIIPEGVTEIGNEVFSKLPITSVTCPSSLLKIGFSAFYGCRTLTSVTLSNGLVEVGNSAFQDCTGLKSIIMYDGVKRIGNQTFCGCISLKSVTIPASVTTIDTYAFSGDISLEDVYYGGSEMQWQSITFIRGVNGHGNQILSGKVRYNSPMPEPPAPTTTPTNPDPAPSTDPDPKPSVKVTGVKLSKTALTMEPGQAETLTATVEPATAENTAVTWTSNASAVASVTSGGRVTALAAGAAEITAKTDNGGFTAVCRVLVKGESKPNAVEVHFPRVNVYNDGQFTDVPANQWYTNGVKQAFEFGLMKGTGAKKFNPQGSVTIAEAIALAARIHSIYTTGAENFIPSGKWYQVYLDYAFQNGLISYAYYNSDVSKNATRAQVAEIFANALPEEALAPTNDVTDGAIPDVPMSESYASHVYKLYRAGIFTGGDVTGSFFPYTYITRQESATIVARIAESSNRLSFTLD